MKMNKFLTDGVYKKLQTSITHISRSLAYYFVCAMLMSAEAWRVKFNLGNATFVADIQTIHNLVDLALSSSLSSPAPMLFYTVCVTCCIHLHYLIVYSHMLPWVGASTRGSSWCQNGTLYQLQWILKKILTISRAETNLWVAIVCVRQVWQVHCSTLYFGYVNLH